MRPHPGGDTGIGLGSDDEGVPERRLRDLPLSRGPPHAVLGKGGQVIGRGGEFPVSRQVIIGARDDADAVPMREVGERLERRSDRLGVGDVELAVGAHKVVLGVDVPEDRDHSRSPRHDMDRVKSEE